MKRRILALLTLTLALTLGVRGALLAADASIFPDTDTGRRAAAYIEAFNSGREDAMRAYLEANVAKEGLAQRPIDQRLAIFREMSATHHTFTPVRRVSADDQSVEVVVRTGGGESLDLTFMFEPAAPHGLMGIRITDAGPGDGPAPATPATPLPDDQVVKAWSAWLDSLTGADAFSGAVVLTKNDQVLFQSAYGYASRKDRTKNRVDTKFNLGSINKVFTTLAIAQLVEAGKVKLDDTIDHYLTDYPKAVASKVTVRQLLEHRGGIGDIFGANYDRADHAKLRNVADFIPLFRDQPLAFEPGTREQYSNGGYVLLGAIVEKASGEDYYDYVRRHVYGPLGMKQTDSYADDEKVANRAMGYTKHADVPGPRDAAGYAENTASRPMRGSPAGGGYSTLADLLAFTRAVRAGTLVRPETRADFPILGPGPGGEVGMGIGGGAPGINAAIEVNGPYTIIVLTNLDPPSAAEAARKARLWLPGPSGSPRAVRRVGAGEDPRPVTPAPAGGAGTGTAPGGEARVERHDAGDEKPQHVSIPAGGVDVEMKRSNRLPTVQVMVDGKGPYRFGIDTGAAGLLRVDSTLAAALHLEVVGQVRGGDPSGRNTRVMNLVAVKSVEIGGSRFEGLTAAVRPYNESRLGEPIDGILGFGLFRDCLLTLDYPASRVRVESGELPPADGDRVIPFTLRHGIPAIRLSVDSLTVDADVDAGSMGGLSLPVALAARLPLATPLRVVGHARTVSSEFDIQGAELNGSARLGGWAIDHPLVDFQPVFPTGNVGSRVLEDFRITFDQKNGRMRLIRRA